MKNKIIYTFLLIFLLSCETTKETTNNTEINTELSEKENDGKIIEPIKTPEEIHRENVENYINNMTIEEKIGQLFIFQIRGTTEINQNTKDLLSLYNPGGIILFANNIINNEQVLKLNKDLQESSSIPLFISVDEEGGIVSRLGKNKNIDVTHLPPALTVGSKNNLTLGYNSGKILGRELKALGFNMDMAPVADVNTNPENPVIGNRTYSNDPYKVADFIEQVIYGFKEENVIAVIKHFPGHGDTSTDTHLGTVVSPHSRERLDQIEFVPFIRGIEKGVDIIMTAHMTMPQISKIPLPATLNRDILTGILREDLNFNGIIMTDAMDMGAISNYYSSGEAALMAINAGVDIILIPYNQPDAFNYLLDAYNNKQLTDERLEKSLFKIISLKMNRGILDKTKNIEDIYSVKQDPEHQKLINSIFEK